MGIAITMATTQAPPAPRPPMSSKYTGGRLFKATVHLLVSQRKTVEYCGFGHNPLIESTTLALANREKQKQQRVSKPQLTVIPWQNIEPCIEVVNLNTGKVRTVSL